MPKHDLDKMLAGNMARERSQHKAPAAAMPAISREALVSAPIITGRLTRERIPAGLYFWYRAEEIDDNPMQPRHDDEGDITETIESFNQDGQMQAALIRWRPGTDRLQNVFGHRRKRAVILGGNAGSQLPNAHEYLGLLLCVMAPADAEGWSNLKLLRMAGDENLRRKDLSLLDTARYYRALREETTHDLVAQGYKMHGEGRAKAGEKPLASWRKVAEHNGYDENKFADMARVAELLELPDYILKQFYPSKSDPNKFVFNGRHGRALLTLNDKEQPEQLEKQRELFKHIVKNKIAGSDAERLAREFREAMRVLRPSPQDKLNIGAFQEAQNAQADRAQRENQASQERGENPLRSIVEERPSATDRTLAEKLQEAHDKGQIGSGGTPTVANQGVGGVQAERGHAGEDRPVGGTGERFVSTYTTTKTLDWAYNMGNGALELRKMAEATRTILNDEERVQLKNEAEAIAALMDEITELL